MKAVGGQSQKPKASSRVVQANAPASGANRKRKMATSPPTTVELRGLNIHFPFQPYDCQKEYMGKVLDALLQKQNALLESPTGTGKTLCLLCATLAWQRNQAKLIADSSNLQLSQQQPQQQPQSQCSTTGDGNNHSNNNNNKPSSSKRVPTIVYASRTHSQLSQVVNELRNTRYRPKHAVLGSREQMCVNPKVKKANATSADINHDCNALAKERKCRFRNRLEHFSAPNTHEGGSGGDGRTKTQAVLDMEDLVQMGKDHQVCPFYYTRSLLPDAELVLMPYNYLFDKDSRETTLREIDWHDAVVIFDEAHNLEAFATESASFDLTQTDIAICLAELNRAFHYVQAMGGGGGNDDEGFPIKSDNLLRLKSVFLRFEDYVANLERSGAFSGEMMMDIFTKGMGVNHANHHLFIDECRKVNEMLLDASGGGGGASGSTSKGAPKLEHFVQCIKRVFGEQTEGRCLAKAKSYRVHITPKVNTATSTGPHNKQAGGYGARNSNKNNNSAAATRTMSYWCFAPALAMQELDSLKIRSILVTSGTLSPLQSYSMELGLSFPHTLENPHIISKEQIHVRVIGKGVSGKQLNSSYQRRQDTEYYIELGNTLVSLAKVIPGGMLIFFPSYSVMETSLERWGGPASSASRYNNANNKSHQFFAAQKGKAKNKNKSSQQFSFPFTAPSVYGSAFSATGTNTMTPWKRLLGAKSVVVEPKSTADLHDAISEFHKYLDMPKSKGCILMGVCRGKISEGIDFANNMSRAVVITGLPFPPAFDPKVKLKREYLDAARASNSMKSKEEGGFGDFASNNGQENSSTGLAQNTLSGHEWYSQQAHRAVNQAIGRVIRNRNDYGSVLLLDSRYSQPVNQQGLSKWVKPFLLLDEGFGTAISTLAKFYRQAEAKAKELEQASKGIMLAYEEEEEERERLKKQKQQQRLDDEDNAFTKVAFVQNFTRGLKQAKPELETIKIEDNHSMKADGYDTDGPVSYIAPDRVIARIDVKAAGKKKEPTLDPLKKPEPAPPRESVFNWSRKQGAAKTPFVNDPAVSDNRISKANRNIDTKPIAAQFLERAKVVLSSSDLSSLKKSVIAMKQFGDKKDERSYLKAAREVLLLCERHEHFFVENHRKTLMALFFRLLGKPYARKVELMAMNTLYTKSTLCQLCKANLQPEVQNKLLNMFPHFLRSLWVDGTTSDKTQFLKEAQKVLVILQDSQDSLPACVVEAFAKIVPPRFAAATHALVGEMKARGNIRRLKAIDASRKRGEDAIDSSRFQNHGVAIHQLSGNNKVKLESSGNVSMPQKVSVKKENKRPVQPEVAKKGTSLAKDGANDTKKAAESFQGRVVTGPSKHAKSARTTQQCSSSSSTMTAKPSATKSKTLSSLLNRAASSTEKDVASSKEAPRAPSSNATVSNNNLGAPPAYSRHSNQVSKFSSNHVPKQPGEEPKDRRNGNDIVARMLEEAESQPYVKRTTGEIMQNLKSNVPSHVSCVMCHERAKNPLLGDCGHMACKGCWLQWLRKVLKCPVCRADMKKESLARVVFQDSGQRSGGTPTFSQL